MRIKSRRVVLWNYDEPFANVSPLGVVSIRCELRFLRSRSLIARRRRSYLTLTVKLKLLGPSQLFFRRR